MKGRKFFVGQGQGIGTRSKSECLKRARWSVYRKSGHCSVNCGGGVQARTEVFKSFFYFKKSENHDLNFMNI